MNTIIRSSPSRVAIFELAALLGLTVVLGGCKKGMAPSDENALVRTTAVESTENVCSDSDASLLAQGRAEKSPEPRIDRADTGKQLMEIENRAKIVALEREERLLLEAIIAAKAGSAMTAQTENIKEAERALELATDRYMVGAGTQTDVLNAQTALTEVRGSYIDALRTYSAVRATFVRATGKNLGQPKLDAHP